jgi:hypothetical protein
MPDVHKQGYGFREWKPRAAPKNSNAGIARALSPKFRSAGFSPVRGSAGAQWKHPSGHTLNVNFNGTPNNPLGEYALSHANGATMRGPLMARGMNLSAHLKGRMKSGQDDAVLGTRSGRSGGHAGHGQQPNFGV